MASEQSFWDREDPAPATPLRGVTQAQVAVVGGGIAGLSVAYHLARAGVDVALVEAGRVGDGATGRSTGMLGPGVGDGVLAVRRRFGDGVAREMMQATVEAVDLVRDLAQAEGIACDLVPGGQVHAALTPGHARRRWQEAQAWRALGVDAEWLDGPALRQATGSDAYVGGLRLEPAALVDPVRLCRGLRDAAVRRGARVHEATRVVRLEPGRVITAQGEVRARDVVVATNAFTPALGLLPGQVVLLHARALVSAPLPAEALAALGGVGRDAVIDARSFFHYHRLTPDGRLLLGGATLRRRPRDAADDARAWARLTAEVEALFPALAPLRVDGRWSGPLGFTWDRLPLVGQVAPRLHALVGWCGHGLALGAWSGARLASALAGQAPLPALPWVRGRAPAVPAAIGRVVVAAMSTALDVMDGATCAWPRAVARSTEQEVAA